MHGVELHPQARFAEQGLNTTNLHLFSHAGTHLDAPAHFLGRRADIGTARSGEMPGPGPGDRPVPQTTRPVSSPSTDLAPYSAAVRHGSRLLLRTDWDNHADQPDYRTSFPRIGLGLAEWLA